jgi:hypothetical protein
MAQDTIVVKVPLDDGGVTALRFRRDVFRHLVEGARAEGCALQDYLARRVLASGIGEDSTGGQAQEAVQTTTLTE